MQRTAGSGVLPGGGRGQRLRGGALRDGRQGRLQAALARGLLFDRRHVKIPGAHALRAHAGAKRQAFCPLHDVHQATLYNDASASKLRELTPCAHHAREDRQTSAQLPATCITIQAPPAVMPQQLHANAGPQHEGMHASSPCEPKAAWKLCTCMQGSGTCRSAKVRHFWDME